MAVARFSVVIPAHDEESVIGRCLGFVAELEPGEAEVVVVANGCRDATAERARSVPGVRVVELGAAGKAEALNAGDRAATAFPRIYLDADIDLDAAALRQMGSALTPAEPRICAPTIEFRTEGRPWPVRAFYRIYAELPYVRESLVGLGVYGISATGRARFDAFPQLTADDLYVQRLFTPSERIVLDDDAFRVETPRTLGALIAVRARAAFGAAELASATGQATSGAETGRALASLVARNPRLLPQACAYAAITVIARLRARHYQAGQWHRDSSTR
jgi:glycosyltransferase involved in cell wall biosynthesis